MRAQKGYYSVVQYCPDSSRLEVANLGVLLFVPEKRFVQARFSGGNDRVRRFFGKRDLDFINHQKHALETRLTKDSDRFKTLSDLENFIAKRANEVVLTPPRSVKVTVAEEELKSLCERLVGGIAMTAAETIASTSAALSPLAAELTAWSIAA